MSEYPSTEIPRVRAVRGGESRISVAVAMGAVLMMVLSMVTPGVFAADVERRLVTVMHAGAHEAFWARLAAEIEIAGFSISAYAGTAVPDEREIETVLQNSCAFVFIDSSTRTLALHYRTPDGQHPHLVMPLPQTGQEEQVTSMHIAEVLRVAFDTDAHRHPATADRPAAPAIPPVQSAIADKFVGELASEVLFGDLSKGPQFGVCGVLGIQLASWMHVGVDFHAPIRGIVMKEREGEVRMLMAGLGVHVGVIAPFRRFRPQVRLGYRLWLIRATTTPSVGFEGEKSVEVTGGPLLFTGGTIMLNPRLGITLGGTVAMAMPAISYDVTHRNVARIGRPLLGVSLGISRFARRREQ